jgi:NAD+ diphosphatase
MSAFRFCPKCGEPLVLRMIADRERLLCVTHECGFVHWDNPVPVVAALIQCADREGRILLARNHAWAEGKFGLVTGFVEREESTEQAVAREVKEEVGLETDALDLIGVYPFVRKNEVIIAYHIVGRGDIVLNEELAEFRLVAPQRLRPWEFGTGLAVRDWLAKQAAGT